MNDLIEKIKKKKELSGLSDEFVRSILEEQLTKKKISIENLKPSTEKILIKDIRAQLRLYTGRFQNTSKKKELSSEDLLKRHLSTKERVSFYPKLKSIISKINPKSILDLGCGINPIALAEKKIEYHATDIKEDELKLIKEFFKKNKIKGSVFYQDLRNPTKIPKTELTLIFKVLDILDIKGHKKAEELLDKIKSQNMIVSFPTKTISGKTMNQPRRIWFEKYLERKQYKFETLKSPNEIFYLISK